MEDEFRSRYLAAALLGPSVRVADFVVAKRLLVGDATLQDKVLLVLSRRRPLPDAAFDQAPEWWQHIMLMRGVYVLSQSPRVRVGRVARVYLLEMD